MLATLAPPVWADGESAFSEAIARLELGEFDAARDALETLVDDGRTAPEVFHQLGNAHYRLGDSGRAALAYRRALYLDPGHLESAQNLEFLRRKRGIVETFEPAGWEFARRIPEGWLSLGLNAGIWIAAIAAALWIGLRRKPGWVRPLLLPATALGITSASAAGVLAAQRRAALPPTSSAIVIESEVVARSAPADSASEVLALPPGSAVTVAAERGPWSYVDLPDGLRAWVRGASVEPLWPYEPGSGG